MCILYFELSSPEMCSYPIVRSYVIRKKFVFQSRYTKYEKCFESKTSS